MTSALMPLPSTPSRMVLYASDGGALMPVAHFDDVESVRAIMWKSLAGANPVAYPGQLVKQLTEPAARNVVRWLFGNRVVLPAAGVAWLGQSLYKVCNTPKCRERWPAGTAAEHAVRFMLRVPQATFFAAHYQEPLEHAWLKSWPWDVLQGDPLVGRHRPYDLRHDTGHELLELEDPGL